MSKEYRVNVYLNEYEKDEVVGRVRYNQILDFWDGRNYTCGSVGRHKGLTKLKDGRYVLIIGTQWQGERDYAYIITPSDALQEIMRSDNMELLKTQKFKDLRKLYDEKYGHIEELEEE